MENVVLKKKEGKITVMNLTPSLSKKLNDDKIIHLCWGNCNSSLCKNACPSKCSKIADEIKKSIDEYDFITSGIQVMNENGQIENFIVTECENYERTGERKLTPQERRHIKHIREALRTLYFDASNLDEAYIKQYMQMVHGGIKAKGKTLSDDAIFDKIIQQPDAEILLKEILKYKQEELEELERATEKERCQKFIKRIKEKLTEIKNEREDKEQAHKMEIQKILDGAKNK